MFNKNSGLAAILEVVMLVLVTLAIVVAAAYARGATPQFDEIIARQYDGSRQRLRALGMDDSHFEKLVNGRPIVTDEHETLLRGLDRLSKISRGNLEKWTRKDVSWAAVIAGDLAAAKKLADRKYQGQIFPVVGRVTRVELRRALPDQVPFFVNDRYFRCEVTQNDGQPPVVVYTLRIPKDWRRGRSSEKGSRWTLDTPVRFAGVFLKLGPPEPKQNVIVMTRHIAWHPDRADPALGVTAQHVLLAGMGMDIGLFDSVRNSKKISGKEYECFYQLLALMGRLDPDRIEQAADRELRRLQTAWPKMADDFQRQSEAADDPKKRKLLIDKADAARLAARDAKEGHFSVYPLFNLANEHQCQLVTLEGIARRVFKVQADDPIGRPEVKKDFVARFGLDHYYQVHMFPDDSQNNLVVFNICEIPPDLPLGDNLREHIKITGFFYKTWPYRNRAESSVDNRRTAPLLIGRRLHWSPKRESSMYFDNFRMQALIVVGLFLLALIGLCVALWIWRRGDRRFDEIARAKNYSIPPGQSLNNMGIEADDGPDFSGLK